MKLGRRRSVTSSLRDHCRRSRFADGDAIGLGLSVWNQCEGIGALLIERDAAAGKNAFSTPCAAQMAAASVEAPGGAASSEVWLVLTADGVDGLEHRDLHCRHKAGRGKGGCAPIVLTAISFHCRTTLSLVTAFKVFLPAACTAPVW